MKLDYLLNKLHDQLKELETEKKDILQLSSQSIVLCRSVLSKMNRYITAYSFVNEVGEIDFFKNIKVQPLSQLIYFSEVRSFEIQYPKASTDQQKKYLNKKIKKINRFFDYNIEFIQYVKEERTDLDSLYYTRANYNSLNITNTKAYYRVPEFSTSHDILLAKLKGFNRFINYLQKRQYNLENHFEINASNMHKKSNLQWTSSKAALIELIYALHSCGAINNGAIDIKQIADRFAQIFNIDLGNYYHTFIEIKSRKTNSTKFLDSLKESFLKRMEESDEKSHSLTQLGKFKFK